jgi:hypothetical protein
MTQSSREALIDLLFLSLYLDDHLSHAEDAALTSALDSLGWDSPHSREKAIYSAFSSAREMAADAIKAGEFINSRADVIKLHGDETVAITWLSRTLSSDGLTYMEKGFLKQIESRLFP